MRQAHHDALYVTNPRPLEPTLPPVSEHLSAQGDRPLREVVWEPRHRRVLEDPAWRDFVARDPHPLPGLPDRDHYFGDRHLEYWISGLSDARDALAAVEQHGAPLPPDARVVDLGGSSGRFLRHFLYLRPSFELACADIHDVGVRWIQQHLPQILGLHTLTIPHLPFEDNSVDLLTAFSVFTHIDVFEITWLMELKRILKPGGVAYLTFHSERLWSKLEPGHFIYDYLVEAQSGESDHAPSEALFRAPMPTSRVAFRTGGDLANMANIFHRDAHICSVWGRVFDCREIIPRGHVFQDVAVLVKR